VSTEQEENVMGALARRRSGSFDWPAIAWPSWMGTFPELPDIESALDRDAMRIEERRDGDQIVVRAEIPGIDPDKDVEITMLDRSLRITAERREEKKEEEGGGYRSEFRYGRFSRVVPLPAGATEDDVSASYADGILEVRVPVVKEVAEGRKISISRT
jgi:HSP20 family protein